MTTSRPPATPSPEPGHSPGYPEKQPADRDQARHRGERRVDPDEGGLDREPESTPPDA